jgi:gliding motility-associated-like protein
MNRILKFSVIIFFLTFVSYKVKACHGLALLNYNVVVGPTGVTVNGSSDGSTCGCGPYWMQVEIACTAAGLTGLPSAATQNVIDNWAGPGTTYNAYPWFFGLLNVPNYTIGNNWPDQCVVEPYTPVFIPFSSLCPGQTYFLRAREWLGGSTAIPPAGPWSAMMQFTVPGPFLGLNYSVTAVPPNYCAPNSATLAATNVNTSACGNVTYLWTPGGATTSSIVVSPGSNTIYSVTVSAPCNAPLTKTIQVNVGTTPSAAFTPLNPVSCTGSPINFNHTGTAGVTHTWSVAPALGVSIVSPNIANPVVTFANPGNYVVTHVVANASCSNTLTTNVTINPGPNPAFTVPTPTQCLVGNSYSFVGATAGGTHSYTFNPAAGAPATGATANYGPGSFTAPGVYTVFHSVTLSGCTANTTSVISVSPHPSLTLIPTNAICGNNNGSIQINNTTPPPQTVVSYSLNGGAIVTQTPTGLPTGAYTIGLTNNLGCVTTSVTNILNTPGVTNLATTFVNPSCGFSNGSITLGLVTGGTAPYTYSVNNGPFVAAPPLTNLAAGNYTITVKDLNNCVFTKVVTLVNTPAITAATFTTAPTACVGNTGVLGITGVTGGTPAYSFSVNGVGTSTITNNLAVGPKTITVKDVNGCTFTLTANIPMVTGPTAATVAVTPAACGNANGSATVTAVTGGAPAYQYSFNGGPFVGSAIQAGMLAGPKSVVVQDANSCTLTINFVVGNTGSPSAAIATLTNVSCFNGANGGFSVSASGGTPGYSYTLTPGNITSGFGVFTNLTAQAYTINVKDALGCITTVTTTIGQPSAVTLSLTSLQPSCFGGNNGTITATGGGGTSPYVFNINGGPNQVSNTFTNNIAAGAYNITVIDNLGCATNQTIAVTQPSQITTTLSSVPANCSAANGSASVIASGGTPIYTYTWAPSGGNNPQTVGVASGNYTVTVKDTKNCTVTAVVSVTATPGGTAAITNTTNVSCFGFANGSLTANMIGNATAPLTYSWSNTSTLQTISNLAPGNYTVTVTDFYGCKSTTVGTVTQPSSITVTPASSPALCFGGATGSASVVAAGGTPGYTYLWSPNGSTTTVSSGLSMGTYSIQVTDANGCTLTRTVTVTQPTSVTINTSTLTANCNQANGVVSATATGGTPAYTYTWSTGFVGQTLSNVTAGTYTVQVKDANNCLYVLAGTVPNASGPQIGVSSFTNPSCFGGNNGIATTTISGGTAGPGFPIYSWSNGQNTGTATNLLNGVYTVTLTDATGCIASASVTITQPSSLTINVSGVNPKCFNAINGTANAGVAGGTGPYSYAWLPAPGAGGTTATPSGMGPGNYNVTVTDAKGCIIQGTVGLQNPAQMLSSITQTNVSCFAGANGLAVASTSNTVGSISYLWTGGPFPLTTQNVSGLSAGTFTMLATDQNSCTATTVFTITQPPLLTVSISAVGSVSCSGGNNGFATAAPNGGTPGYTYNWSNAQTTATSNSLIAGSYTITVTDTKSCTATAVAVINQPSGLTVVATKTNAPCFGGFGIGNVNYSGGTGIPSILWTPNLAVTQYVNNLPASATPYTITLTDANGCSTFTNITITQPTQLVANITTVVPTNCGQANGSSSVAASGGAGGYTYQWSSNPSFTNAAITSVVSGPYTVTVSDANNCSITTATFIPNILAPIVALTNSVPVTCFGLANGGATVTVSGGAGGNTYLWSYLAQTSQNVNNLPSGLHSITVTDLAGCQGGLIVNITQPTQLVTAIGSVTNVACAGQFNGAAQMLSVGGTTNYAYLWQPSAQTNSVLTGVQSGIYSCTVTDANNCTSTKTVNISQPNPLLINTNTVIPNLCNSFSTGIVNTSITGGTPTYTLTWTPAQPANPIITNLGAGSYSLSVVDAQGCPTSSVYTLVDPPAFATPITTTTQATCGNSNGTANVTITGGSPAYAYNWNTQPPQTTANATGLPPGTWQLTTTDSKGCVITASVNINAAALPSVTAVSSNVLCFGQPNGSATVTASGVGGYSYSWTPTGLTSAIINGLTAPTSHTVVVTDANSCTVTTAVNISQPNQLILNVSPTQTICYGTSATIFGQAGGGSTPYSYTFTDLNSSITNTLLTPNGFITAPTLTATNQYTMTVTDLNGCKDGPKSILVNVLAPLGVTAPSFTACAGGTVQLSANATGGFGPGYSWSNGANTAVTTVTTNYANNNPALNPNKYIVTVDDNCSVPTASAIVHVTVYPNPDVKFTPFYSKGCAPLTVTFTGLNDSTTTNPDPFFWSFSGGSEPPSPSLNPQTISFPNAGTYSLGLVVTNKYGCKQYINDPLAVEVFPVPVASFFTNPSRASLLEPTINFTNTSTNASSYVWDFGDYSYPNTNASYVMNPNHLYTNVGNYQIYLVAINSQGCKDTATATIEITPDMGVYIPNAFTPDGNGRNDVFMPYGYGINEDKYKMEVFDRWGELIFSSTAFRKGWDGTVKGTSQIAQDGVYIYKIMITDLENNKKNYVGHVTLIKQ